MDKFEHGFSTQLGAVLLWRRVRSGGLMLACNLQPPNKSCRRQKKSTFFLGIQKGPGVRQFLWVSLSTVSARN